MVWSGEEREKGVQAEKTEYSNALRWDVTGHTSGDRQRPMRRPGVVQTEGRQAQAAKGQFASVSLRNLPLTLTEDRGNKVHFLNLTAFFKNILLGEGKKESQVSMI